MGGATVSFRGNKEYGERPYSRDGDPCREQEARIGRAASYPQGARRQVGIGDGDGAQADEGRLGGVVDEPGRWGVGS